MIHPDSDLRFVNETIGYSLFATKLIPKGTFTWIRDDLDQIVDPAVAVHLRALAGTRARMRRMRRLCAH